MISEPPASLINCHCGFCRHLSGAAFSTWATVTAATVLVLRSGSLRHYQASGNCTRAFCEACGTHVFSKDRRLIDKIGIPAGVIDAKNLPGVSGHYFVDDKASWHSIEDTHPCFGGASGFQPLTRT
jgi:hypothetical protein